MTLQPFAPSSALGAFAAEIVAVLVALGAGEEHIAAARVLDDPSATNDIAATLAAGARRALSVRWTRGGRVPAAHAIEAVIALAGDDRALVVAAAVALVRLRNAPSDALAHEVLEVWAPLSARLGVRPLQRELEDLAFKVAHRHAYDAVARFVARTRAERERLLAAVLAALSGALARGGIAAETHGRTKHLWSIHRKLCAREDREPRLYDLIGLRVLVDEPAACYEALGAVHAAFEALPDRFKDYLARPKPNGYRSLHTVVRMPGVADEPVEIQIRTRAMHLSAERGAAAHFRYKHPGAPHLLRSDAKWVYPLTPRGEVRRLPCGATALDFAYAIHTDLGHGYTGARIGERLVRLETPLATGDVVHILHSARARPTERQLARVRTARARNRIRAVLRARREGTKTEEDEARPSTKRRDAKRPCREAA